MAVPYGENQYIYGLHDPGGEELLIDDGKAKGWVLVTEAIGADPDDQSGRGDFYEKIADLGLGVIVRLNHAYGPSGTIPVEAQYRAFAQRAANFVKNSSGAHIWIIGNEMNFEREQPRLNPGSPFAQPITPRRYAECYTLCRRAIKSLKDHADDQVVVGAIGPWNAQTAYEADPRGNYPENKISGAPADYPYNGFFGDFIIYLRDILLAIGRKNCDAIAIHAYSHGYKPDLIFSDQKMGPPFQNYHYHFRTYQDQMKIIPKTFRDLPAYLTESNGDVAPNGAKWPNVNSGWVKNAYKEINSWNTAGNQQIRCMLLYRWSRDDEWHIIGKEHVQQDLREAVQKSYTWNPDIDKKPEKPARPPVVEEIEDVKIVEPIPRPARPGYRTRFITHNTPTTVTAGQTLPVSLTIQNLGSFTWVNDGRNPFRLGFHWRDSDGQVVQIPPELDFRTPLPRDIAPNESVILRANLRTPAKPGTYQLRWDMVHELVTWFTTQGDAGLLVTPVTVSPAVTAPEPKPEPVPKPKPTPEPTPEPALKIRNVVDELTQHPTKQYATRPLDAIDRIIVHHTATPAHITVQRIAEYQVNQKELPGTTYHFCITAQGKVYQTQPLSRMAAHAGQNSRDSVGVCLIGNFTDAPPPPDQLNAAAYLIARLLQELDLTTNDVVGYSEIARTQSPGATWPTWKETLLDKVRELLPAAPPPETEPIVEGKPIDHYLLLWHRGPGDWAEWQLRGALDYIARFPITIGFSVDEAKLAKAVTVVGGPNGVPASVDEALRNAGSQVDRIAGATERETRQILEEMAAEGKRFRNLR